MTATPGGVVFTIEGEQVRVVLPEGGEQTARVEDLGRAFAGQRLDLSRIAWPPGVVGIFPMHDGLVVAHQTQEFVASLRWYRSDTPRRLSESREYRNVRIALPYLIVFASFLRDGSGRLHLTNANEAFFSNRPVQSVDDPLLYPALLNCSRFHPIEGRPLSWICTQLLPPPAFRRGEDDGQRVRHGLAALVSHLLDTGFNDSSDLHELSSWFTETARAGVDARVATIEAWEAATEANPGFATEVPWLPTGFSLRVIAERMIGYQGRQPRTATSALALLRLLSPLLRKQEGDGKDGKRPAGGESGAGGPNGGGS